MTHKIKIKLEDVEDFVLKRSDVDPVEVQIGDARYEVLNFGIYDHKLKRPLPQSDGFNDFAEGLFKLKQSRICAITKKSFCEKLMKIAPTEINL